MESVFGAARDNDEFNDAALEVEGNAITAVEG